MTPQLDPTGVVYTTRNREGEHNSILVYCSPYGFKVLEGPAVSVNDPLMDALGNNGFKQAVNEAVAGLKGAKP